MASSRTQMLIRITNINKPKIVSKMPDTTIFYIHFQVQLIMKDLKSVYIKMENPNLRQRFVIVSANSLLWLIVKLFKDDEKKMVDEMKDVITSAYKAL